MTKDDVKLIFASKIQGDKDNGVISLPGGATVPIDFFANRFSSVEIPTYDNFVAFDGGIIGYIPFFNECKQEGILS